MENLGSVLSAKLNCGDFAAEMTAAASAPGQPQLQPLWDYLCGNHKEALRSPLMPVILSVSTFFLSCMFYTTLDVLSSVFPALNRCRIHQEWPIKQSDVLRSVGRTLYYQLVLVFPAAVAQWWWRPPLLLERDAPSLPELATGLLGCFLLFDFQYFLWHLLHHWSKWLYVKFHAVHHEYSRPFCWVTQHMSAWEILSVGLWTTVDPVVLRCHTLTGYAFMMLNVWASVDDHSGYDFPWALHNLVPFGLWGGAVKHDTHHQNPRTNFAPYFNHWDWLCGTGAPPERKRETSRKGHTERMITSK